MDARVEPGHDNSSRAGALIALPACAADPHLYCPRRVPTLVGTQHAWEVARVTPEDAKLLLNYMIVAPLLVVGFGLFMYWFTGWLDLREERRHPAE